MTPPAKPTEPPLGREDRGDEPYLRESPAQSLDQPASRIGEEVSVKVEAARWEVEVRVDGASILTIGTSLLSGVEDIDSYGDIIRTCAEHLASFIGTGEPAPCFACGDSGMERWLGRGNSEEVGPCSVCQPDADTSDTAPSPLDPLPHTLSGGGGDEPSLRESPAPELRQLQQRIRELEAALHPFAAYACAMTAYGFLHRGSLPADSKSMAYVQTEAGDSGNVTWGDLKLAQRLMPDARHGGESAAVRWAKVSNRKDGASQKDSTPSPDLPPAAGAGVAWREAVAEIIDPDAFSFDLHAKGPRDEKAFVRELRGEALAKADKILRLTALSAAPPPADSGWRAIGSAPKDGTEFDVWLSTGRRLTDVWWNSSSRAWNCEKGTAEPYQIDGHPAHWMPRPPPPAENT